MEEFIKERWWECEQTESEWLTSSLHKSVGIKTVKKTSADWIYGLDNETIQHEQRWAQAVITWRVQNTIKAVAVEDYLKRHLKGSPTQKVAFWNHVLTG